MYQRLTLLVDVGGVLVVDHVVEVGDLAVRICNDGELEAAAVDLVDVLDPVMVRSDAVGRLVASVRSPCA